MMQDNKDRQLRLLLQNREFAIIANTYASSG